MSSTDNNSGRRTYDDSDDHDDNGYHYGWYESNGNHYGHDDNETVIDFDSGELTSNPGFSVTFNGLVIEGHTGTYTEDGYQMQWSTFDYHLESETANNLGDPLVDAAPSNNDHANENSYDYAFGANYADSQDLNQGGGEVAYGALSSVEGYNFDLEDLDIVTTIDDNPDNHSAVTLYTEHYNDGYDEYITAYTFDADTWYYDYTNFDHATGVTTTEVSVEVDSLADLLEMDYFDDMETLLIWSTGNMAVDDIELEAVV